MEKPMYKKVSKAGGVTIPSPLRHALNIPKGAAIEMTTTPDDEIIIKKHIPTCLCCGTADHVKTINGVELCPECAKRFIAEVDSVAGGTEHGTDN